MLKAMFDDPELSHKLQDATEYFGNSGRLTADEMAILRNIETFT